jgi:hypothetical protein
MGMVSFLVDLKLLQEALHIPSNCHIYSIEKVSSNWMNICVQGDGLPPRQDNGDPVLVNPTVGYQLETYTWDWNLPKEEVE